MTLTLGSLFDGIGCWQLAAVRADIKPLWSSEVDKFCCQVTHRHFPNTVQLGDINNISDAPKVDIITAGSPCQDLSIGGKQGGIHCERSGLFFKAVEIVRRINPQFFIWENVPNVLYIHGGKDFQTVLQEICQVPIPLPEHFSTAGVVDGIRCQIAWRILDAQYFGTPQRRRRIFLIADFTGRRAAQILFESTRLPGDFKTGSSSQRRTTAATTQRLNQTIGFVPTVTRKHPVCAIYDMTHANEVLRPMTSDKVNSLNARMGTGGNQVPIVFGIGRNAFNQGTNAKFKPTIETNLQPPLTARGAAAVATKIVRRLTPVECERLQGLPDNWSDCGSDTQRYKALGNAMAVPVASFILNRLYEVCL